MEEEVRSVSPGPPLAKPLTHGPNARPSSPARAQQRRPLSLSGYRDIRPPYRVLAPRNRTPQETETLICEFENRFLGHSYPQDLETETTLRELMWKLPPCRLFDGKRVPLAVSRTRQTIRIRAELDYWSVNVDQIKKR